jgi:hypothetical protein
MYGNSYVRPRNLVAAGTAAAVAGAVWLVPDGHAGAVNKASLTSRADAAVPAAAKATTGDPNFFPFGMPSGGPIVNVPSPPGAATLSPTIATKTTTRIYGADSFEEAISVTQHIWPAALPENAPSLVADRPRAVTLLTPDDPLTAITATPIIHFPDDAPVLYVTRTGVPANTLNEIKRLGPSGVNRYNNVNAFLVGPAANSGVESQLTSIGVKWVAVTSTSIPDLANKVDKLYGSIENPDFGVPNMDNGALNVVIGSMDGNDYQFLLPATHWVSHMATGLLWVRKNSVPQATIYALQRRHGQARIYVFGGPNQISGTVVKQLAKYGAVVRITNDDYVAFNTAPADTPEETAIAFSKMWDSAGEMGWKITGPGHGFSLVNINDWQAAVASSPLSHLGFHAPLLFTDSATTLPADVDAYFKSVEPTFLTTPADGPYNMTYTIGSWDKISWAEELAVEYDSEMGNRRDAQLNTGGRYTDSQP